MMVGKLVTRELLTQLFKRVGLKMMAKSASRFVPIVLPDGVGRHRLHDVSQAGL
ncbi:hypothetical protein LP419_18965 [Massilia sp. H-1]|nr:hypothetical protein LP419_18965 [Massilia sp. H-1]